MAISIQCSGCKKTLKARDELAGKRVKCPACGLSIVVNAISPSEVESPEPEKKVPEKRVKPSPPPAPVSQKKRSLMPIYIGGAVVAVCIVIGLVVAFVLPGKDQTRGRTELVPTPTTETKAEVPPTTKMETPPTTKPETPPTTKPETPPTTKPETPPTTKPEPKLEPKPVEPASKLTEEKVAVQLIHQMILSGLFGAKKEEIEGLRRGKSIKESWLRRLAESNVSLETKIAHCLAIMSFPYGIGEAENEYVKSVRTLFKFDLERQSQVLVLLAKSPDFPKNKLGAEVSERTIEMKAGTVKQVDDWELEYFKAITPEYAARLVRLTDYVKANKSEKFDEECKTMEIQLIKALRDNPEQFKVLSTPIPSNEELIKERERVKGLIEKARIEFKPEVVVEPKPDPKKLVENGIWNIKLYNEGFSPNVKPYMETNGAISQDIDGLRALAGLSEQVKNAKDDEFPLLKQRTESVIRGCVAHSRGEIKDVYRPMLTALEKKDYAEFNRLANIVNARILWNNAMDNGIPVEGLSTMAKELTSIRDAKNASDQKVHMLKLQQYLDDFMTRADFKSV